MKWIRLAVGIGGDPDVAKIAIALSVPKSQAVGLCSLVFVQLPEHARNGDISEVDDTTLEAWALWEGKRGKFAKMFRKFLCTSDGVVRSWEKHNGAAIRRSDSETERQRRHREGRDSTRDVTPSVTRDNQRDNGRDVRTVSRQVSRVDVTGRDDTNRTTPLVPPPAVDSTIGLQAPGPLNGGGNGEPNRLDSAHAVCVVEIPATYLASYASIRSRAREPRAVSAEIALVASGEHGPGGKPVPWAIIGRALHDLDVAGSHFTSKALAAFIVSLSRSPTHASDMEAKLGRALTAGERTYLNAIEALTPP